MKEQRHEDYAGDEGDDQEQELSLDQLAGAAARRIIRSTEVEDTTPNWRALKRAYLAGHEAASR